MNTKIQVLSQLIVNTGSISNGSPGQLFSDIAFATAFPKTTVSSSEFAPNLLAPCTDTQAHSPQA